MEGSERYSSHQIPLQSCQSLWGLPCPVLVLLNSDGFCVIGTRINGCDRDFSLWGFGHFSFGWSLRLSFVTENYLVAVGWGDKSLLRHKTHRGQSVKNWNDKVPGCCFLLSVKCSYIGRKVCPGSFACWSEPASSVPRVKGKPGVGDNQYQSALVFKVDGTRLPVWICCDKKERCWCIGNRAKGSRERC